MQQMFRYGVTAVFFLICTWEDIRTGKISCRLICFFSAAGILGNLLFESSLRLLPVHMLPGIGILLFGRMSGEQIGYGDGLVMTAAGLFLTGKEIVSLFLTGLLLCALFAMAMFISGKAGKKTAIPFLPFLTGGFVIHMLFLYTA